MDRLIALIVVVFGLVKYPRSLAYRGITRRTESTDKNAPEHGRRIISELQIPKAVIEHYVEDKRQQQELEQERLRIERSVARIDRKRLWIEGATLGFVVIATIGAFVNLWFLKDSVDAGREAAAAARAQVEQTAQAFRFENRPWILVKPSIPYRSTQDPVRMLINAEFVNRGNGPAFMVSNVIRGTRVVENSESAVNEFVRTLEIPTPPQGEDIIFPNIQSTVPIVGRGTNAQWNDIMSGRVVLFFFARVDYGDSTTLPAGPRPYSTAICMRFNPQGLPWSRCTPSRDVMR